MDPLTVEELQTQLDEANARIALAEEREAETAKKEREQEAKDYIAEVSKIGLSAYPGFLAEVEKVLLADDGDAALLLSEDGVDTVITATQIVKNLINALPKNDDGLILLAQQAVKLDDDKRPPLSTDDERTQEERTAAAIAFLGLDKNKGFASL